MILFLRDSILFFAVALHLIGVMHGKEPPEGRRVMTWVPPYAVSACKERLNQSFDGIGMKDGLTHLGLQFWSPTSKGGIELVDRFEGIDESTISEFQNWGDEHGVRILLCIYNGTASGWDWDLAKTAFDENRTRSYDFLKAAAGDDASKLLIGMTSSASEWQDIPVEKNLQWIVDNPSVGLAMWDAQLKAPEWRTQAMWQAIAKIKNGADADDQLPAHSESKAQ